MWLENLIKLKENANKTCKEIAEGTKQPERTIIRIFHGETDSPSISTLIPIIRYLNGSIDDVFFDTGAVIGNEKQSVLKETIDNLSIERDLLKADNINLKQKLSNCEMENEMLKKQITFMYNYYNAKKD